MPTVPCSVDRRTLENESYREVEGVAVTCSRCNHEEESFGTSDKSIKRCLVLLREHCPRRESNFYVEE